ncbi:MAG TPA: hypothetical protein VM535_01395 [Candidatus Saccharimonadales bacterium]|nr:hypothetical protein [Candidatus Saccharimonadales bacterium]
MNIELTNFRDLPRQQQLSVAETVAAYSQDPANEHKIVPVYPEDIIHQKQLGVVALNGARLAGYVGAAAPLEHEGRIMSQVGTLSVMEPYQNKGVACRLIGGITLDLVGAGQVPYAFCNPASQRAFEKAGYVPAEAGQLPSAAASRYGNRPLVLDY